jgi:hypothetical protein
VYNSFDLTQAWNSLRNEAISETRLRLFMDPSDAANQLAGKTNYLFVIGKGTMFPADNAIQMMNIVDGLSNTIAMVEMKNSATHWAEPEDLDFSQPRRLPPGSGLVLFADGSVRRLDASTTPVEIRQFATIDAGDMAWLGVPAPIVPPQPSLIPETPAAPGGPPPPPSVPATPGAAAPAQAPDPPQPEQEP